EKNRSDILFLIMGTGDALNSLIKMVQDYNLENHVHFTGWAEQEDIATYLSVTSLGVDTMPKTPYSDAATTNKILEYMSVECPIVCFDLVESRVSAGDAAIYAEPDNVVDLAEKILALLEDEEKRKEMGRLGRHRIETELSWEHQADHLLAAYDAILR